MNLADYLRPEHIVVPLEAPDFKAAIAQLVDRLAQSGALHDTDSVNAALLERSGPELATIGSDVALPHYRTDAADRLLVAIGIAREPLPRNGIEPAPRVIALVLSPPGSSTLHLQIVAALARLFRQADVRERIRDAPDPAAVRAVPQLAEIEIQPRLAAKDIMSVNVRGVSPDTPLGEAITLMASARAHALPVLNEKSEVLGVVTDGDILRALSAGLAGGDDNAAVLAPPAPVRDVMTRSVLCVSEETSVEEIVNLMIGKELEQLPVVHEGRFTGWVSRTDLIRKLFFR